MTQFQPHGWRPYPVSETPQFSGPIPTKTQAIWALILSFIPFPLTLIGAIVLAIVVLSKPKDIRGSHGKGMAAAALVIVVLWIAGFIGLAAAGAFDEKGRDSAPVGEARGDVSVDKLEVGDCLIKDIGVGTKYTVELIPCAEPHRQEVFSNFSLPSGDYPGQKTVIRLAEGGCFKRFEGYVGIDPARSKLKVFYLHPLSSSWSRSRVVTCLVSDGTTRTSTLKDTGGSGA